MTDNKFKSIIRITYIEWVFLTLFNIMLYLVKHMDIITIRTGEFKLQGLVLTTCYVLKIYFKYYQTCTENAACAHIKIIEKTHIVLKLLSS